MSKKWPAKDPDDIADYQVNWAARLADGETIVASEWVVPDGLTQDSDENTDTTATIWLSGGTAGTTYDVVSRVTTSGDRQFDQTVKLPVKEL